MLIVWTQVIYLMLSVGMTVYVAQSLHSKGRIFLVRSFDDDEVLADSVNHLLIVGFYLVNIGWVFIWTKYGLKPLDLEAAIEFVTTKVGFVMLILGCVHFFNLWLFWKIRNGNASARPVPPPLP